MARLTPAVCDGELVAVNFNGKTSYVIVLSQFNNDPLLITSSTVFSKFNKVLERAKVEVLINV